MPPGPIFQKLITENGVTAMKKLEGWMVGMVAALALFLGAAGWAQQDGGLAEKAGEKLDELGRAVRRGVENAGDSVREGFARSRDTVQGLGILGRVYGRLHWDKSLHSSNLFLKADGGAVTLRGMVPDAAARAKAVALAADTFGVTRVIDQLTIPEPTLDQNPRPTRARPNN